MKKIVLIALAIVAFAVQLFAEDGTSFYQKALENIKAENFKSAFDNLSIKNIKIIYIKKNWPLCNIKEKPIEKLLF